MKLKTFRAPTMPQVLAQVKRHLGHDAIIVQTRSFKRGGIFGIGAQTIIEITARQGESALTKPRQRTAASRLQQLYSTGLDNNARIPEFDRNGAAPAQAGADGSSAWDKPGADNHSEHIRSEIGDLRKIVESLVREQRQLHEPQMPEQLFDSYLDLIQREVADEIARDMIGRIQRDMTGDQCLSTELVRQRLIQEMDKMISTTGPICANVNGSTRVVALIGPTGVGKTTTIAKIAANLRLRQNQKVGLITIDTYRIGAIDQLRMYAQIIDVPIKVVLTPTELREAVVSMRDMDVVLIDTAGRSQNDQLKIKELETFMKAAQPDEIHLVLSGTAHHAHMISAAEKFNSIGVNRIILTKLDEAVSFGVVLSVLKKINASISYVTTGQDVPDDIEIGNGRRLAQMLLGLDKMTKQEPQLSA